MGGPDIIIFLLVLGAIFLGAIVLLCFWILSIRKPLELARFKENPILGPLRENWWESEAVFNPAAVVHDGWVHIFYRALGRDGISRVGHARSRDGIHFERSSSPAYEAGIPQATRQARLSYGTLSYSPLAYASGGGWGGCEDPRAVIIDEKLHMNFAMFENWGSIRMTLTLLGVDDLKERRWRWDEPTHMSPPNETHKNWVFFPEKIRGKYAVLHGICPDVLVDYVDNIEHFKIGKHIKSLPTHHGWGYIDEKREGFWDKRVKGASSPPIKTSEGWLLFYHGIHEGKYKIGAMLLDLDNPTHVRYRSAQPVLSPEAWYENDWKPGILYGSGAIVLGDDLILYYGGGDKYVAAAKANLRDFVRKLTTHEHATLEPVRM